MNEGSESRVLPGLLSDSKSAGGEALGKLSKACVAEALIERPEQRKRDPRARTGFHGVVERRAPAPEKPRLQLRGPRFPSGRNHQADGGGQDEQLYRPVAMRTGTGRRRRRGSSARDVSVLYSGITHKPGAIPKHHTPRRAAR